MFSRLLRLPRPCSPASWMVPACAVLALLAGGCARKEDPTPREPPKAAAVGAPAEDPKKAVFEKDLKDASREVERWRKAGNAEKEIEARLQVGRIHIEMGNKGDAIVSLEAALSRSKATGYHHGAVVALRNLGYIFWTSKKPEEARKYLDQAIRLAAELGNPGQQADLLYLAGATYYDQVKYSEALNLWKQALQFAEVVKDDKLAADIWNGMGVIYTYFGEREKALQCLDRALSLARRSKNWGAEAAILTGFGLLHRRRGELEDARTLFEKALEINQREGDREGAARVLNQLGGVYLDLGERATALDEYENALAIYRSLGNDDGIAWALFNIGQVYLAEEEPQRALEKFEEAREPSQQGQQPRTAAAVLHGIGVAQLELGRTAEAVRTLNEALPLRRKAGNRLSMSSTLLHLGRAYGKQGDLEQAGSFIENALSLARETQGSFIQAASLFELAKLDRDREDFEEALQRITEAVGILESVRSDLPGDRLKSSFFASKRSYYDLYIDLLMRLERSSPGRGYAAKALGASERARARSLLELLAEGRHEVTRGIDPSLRRQETDLAARLSQIQGELIEALSKDSPEEERVKALSARLRQAGAEWQGLERRIRAKHRRYAEVRYPSPLDLREIESHLDQETALLEYSLGEEGSYLFLVTRDGLEVHSLPRVGEIAAHVQRVRKGVEAPGGLSYEGYVQAAHWLYEKLVAPVRPRLAGKRLLLIAPDGPLHFLSFEVLLTRNGHERDPARLSYLLRDFALGYIPSASVLPLLTEPDNRSPEGASLQFVAFADPVYGPERPGDGAAGATTRGGAGGRSALEGLRQLPRLKGSRLEVRRIAELYSPDEVKIYEGKEANERSVRSNPLVEKAERLHFAAHGVLNEERPAFSGLRLTRDGEDDGLLQVYEIFNLNLTADLVVLSACKSGLGQEVTGEGLVGVTRAFLYAGAPSVVVSLWRVRDDTAPDLMVRFYGGLNGLRGKAEALRQAKLGMIDGGRHVHPYYWGPFILVGKP